MGHDENLQDDRQTVLYNK